MVRSPDGEPERAVLEQRHRDDRLLGTELDQHGEAEQHDGAHDHEDARGRAPLELVARQGHPDQQRRDAGGDEHGAEVVDGDLAATGGDVEGLLQQDDRDHRERHGDVEVPPPSGRVGDHTAQQRPADRGDRHDGAEQAHVAAALTRRDDVGHHDLHQGGETAGAEALKHAERDEHLGVLGEAREPGAHHEDHERELDEELPVGEVGELAPDGRRDGGGEQGRCDDPGVAGLVATQVGEDLGERARHDGRGEHRDEHAEQQSGQCFEHLSAAHGARRGVQRGLLGSQ